MKFLLKFPFYSKQTQRHKSLSQVSSSHMSYTLNGWTTAGWYSSHPHSSSHVDLLVIFRNPPTQNLHVFKFQIANTVWNLSPLSHTVCCLYHDVHALLCNRGPPSAHVHTRWLSLAHWEHINVAVSERQEEVWPYISLMCLLYAQSVASGAVSCSCEGQVSHKAISWHFSLMGGEALLTKRCV